MKCPIVKTDGWKRESIKVYSQRNSWCRIWIRIYFQIEYTFDSIQRCLEKNNEVETMAHSNKQYHLLMHRVLSWYLQTFFRLFFTEEILHQTITINHEPWTIGYLYSLTLQSCPCCLSCFLNYSYPYHPCNPWSINEKSNNLRHLRPASSGSY